MEEQKKFILSKVVNAFIAFVSTLVGILLGNGVGM